MELPFSLRAAVARELDGVSRKALAERAARTSAAYRSGKGSASVIREPADALAYALARLPATYAACVTVFAEALQRAPEFAPRSLLDAGAGPAAASWAAIETWPDLFSISLLDASPVFLDTAARLAADGPDPLRCAARLRADLTSGGGAWPRADLVACSYALAEIPAGAQPAVVAALWAACEGLLVLVEPGTPAGFTRLRQAREALVGAGAAILAPCPHDGACPMTGDDWCHFSVRLPRSRDHKLAKGAEVPFEDEPFAYLVAARAGVGAPAGARVLRPPRQGKPGVDLALCTSSGLEGRFVPRRDKTAYAAVRKLDWGDAV